jgi:hypothetical protein
MEAKHRQFTVPLEPTMNAPQPDGGEAEHGSRERAGAAPPYLFMHTETIVAIVRWIQFTVG